jgi:hypothetical protein
VGPFLPGLGNLLCAMSHCRPDCLAFSSSFCAHNIFCSSLQATKLIQDLLCSWSLLAITCTFMAGDGLGAIGGVVDGGCKTDKDQK